MQRSAIADSKKATDRPGKLARKRMAKAAIEKKRRFWGG
ncbi:hypothetical protein SAMN05444161_2935 [Rhizobiales bacterium GAS191]|nr:hypothetical protein SAMN05444161_2935 [Rhizobiales bacterium GAS191]